MHKFVEPHTLKNWLHDDDEIALFDVREQGQYGESHLFYAVPLPYSRLELDVCRLAPRRSVRLVVYDEHQTIAPKAARSLIALGYTDVHILEGGTAAWKAVGYPLFAGVHVPSKTFGELIEEHSHTPSVSASTLFEMLERGDDVVVLDGRPLSEYHKMTIPGSVCCPNGELSYRVHDMIDSPNTTIVVNCAGRTRSIVGAQTLINLGLPNPVMALENGTQGWYLEDLKLEHGSERRYPDQVSDYGRVAGRAASARVAARFNVESVDATAISRWISSGNCSVFLCDVRTPNEFGSGSLPGAQHTPGGQLIQATDQYIGVRHAKLVLFDDDGCRAPVVASWLKQLGHDAYVLRDGIESKFSLAALENIKESAFAGPAVATMNITTLSARIAANNIRVLDVRPGMQFRKSHIPGATWSIRPSLPAFELFAQGGDVILVGDDATIIALVAKEWTQLSPECGARIWQLEGGFSAWTKAQLEVESTPDLPPDAECIDYLFFVHDRHDGNKAAARQYLKWETGLLAQLDQRERDAFNLDAASTEAITKIS
ncbi:rhodanese-like domain-containing protein [Glaciimonas sp. PAMC28666]|uniref:rhodanese-like domain-containing protein n=1 Tax=Glaciimonas sp. PAMC28666 TaxID=2807626 RepID=UPI00196267EE|nr:rhodanese-like domain-containing protein [Glaciimonas sp. PAMC28666]QRX81472.1 sulfurtransferase [Glaciimonas sp. PAMC28666]